MSQISEESAKQIIAMGKLIEEAELDLSNFLKLNIESGIATLLIKKIARNQYDRYSFFRSVLETDIGKEKLSIIEREVSVEAGE